MNKETREYNLTFFEALQIVLDGGAVKGEQFIDGIFIKLNSYGQLVTVDAGRLYDESEKVFIKGLSRQKFRELSVMTMKELSL